jgi:hypothetical protein
MGEERDHVSKGNDQADVERDPQPSELEIDEANDENGGPTTESLSAGLASPLQPGSTIPGGGPAAGAGSLGTGGGQAAGRDSGNTDRKGR